MASGIASPPFLLCILDGNGNGDRLDCGAPGRWAALERRL